MAFDYRLLSPAASQTDIMGLRLKLLEAAFEIGNAQMAICAICKADQCDDCPFHFRDSLRPSTRMLARAQ